MKTSLQIHDRRNATCADNVGPARDAAAGPIMTMLILIFLVHPALGQMGPAPIPQHNALYVLDSGRHDGDGAQARKAFSGVVTSADAAWLQLHFMDFKLGAGSYVVITSALDGSQQRLDADSLQQWQNASAYFNGDSVILDLYVAPGDADAFVQIREITVGEWVGGIPIAGGCSWSCGICDGDDRVPSTDPRVGRIVGPGGSCTGWIVSNGAHLTAGHCVTGGMLGTLQFNVPLSLCDGTMVNPPPEDQYPIPPSSIVSANTAGFNDWAVFACGPNSDTGLLPVQVQGGFFRMTRDFIPDDARVTGYGIDQSPAGCTGARNQFSQTLQTHAGDFGFNFPNLASISSDADSTCGNSGGPVMMMDEIAALGIITQCTNSCTFASNSGTGFENDLLKEALHAFVGPFVQYVDSGHPASGEDGGVLRPYSTATEAVNIAATGSIISIVAGAYPAALGNTFTAGADGRSFTLSAPVGLVRIGE